MVSTETNRQLGSLLKYLIFCEQYYIEKCFQDPFSKSDNPIKLHPAIIRLGFKAANSHISAHESATGRAKRLMEAITRFIEDFEGRHFEENNDVIGIRSIPQQFLQELNPNINFLSKCRPLVRSEGMMKNFTNL